MKHNQKPIHFNGQVSLKHIDKGIEMSDQSKIASDLLEIEALLQCDMTNLATSSIPLHTVEIWMESESIEVMGAVAELISSCGHFKQIMPPLEFEPYHRFFLRYYERCLLEDPQGKWAHSRYSAGWDIVRWFIGLWDNPSIPRNIIEDLKKWLARIYLASNDSLRTCLVTATLEHLFENPDVRNFFLDWKKDPVLGIAFGQAAEWSE